MSATFNQVALKEEDRQRKEKMKQNEDQKKEKRKQDNAKNTEENSQSSKKGLFKIEDYLLGDFELKIPAYEKTSAFKILPIEFEDFEIGSIENYSLCDGATLKCSQGDATSVLGVLPIKNVFINDKPLAVISDTKPMVNIKPFGMCKSMANPTVAAATAANRGQLKKMPCIPNTVGVWTEGISHFLSDEMTPCDKSKCMCAYAGEISVQDPGQNILGSSGGSSSEEEEKEEKQQEEEKNQTFKDAEIKTAVVTKGFKKIKS